MDGPPRTLVANPAPHGADGDELPTAPPDVVFPEPLTFPDPRPSVVPNPHVHGVPDIQAERPEESPLPKPAYVPVPGISDVPEEDLPRDATPVLPQLPAQSPERLPAAPARVTSPFIDPDETDDPNSPITPWTGPKTPAELTPPTHAPDAPSTHLPATPAKGPAEFTPSTRYATPPNPETPGAPQDPTNLPGLRPDDLSYIPDISGIPHISGPPPHQLAAPVAAVEPRPVPWAKAAMGDDHDRRPDRRRRKRQRDSPTPAQETPPTPDTAVGPLSTPWSANNLGPVTPENADPVPDPTRPPGTSPETGDAEATGAESVRPGPGQDEVVSAEAPSARRTRWWRGSRRSRSSASDAKVIKMLIMSSTVSSAGGSVQAAGLGLLAFALTGSPILAGLIAAAGRISVLLAEPLAGVIADRFESRRTMIAAEAVGLAMAITAGGAIFAGVAGAPLGWLLVATVLVEGAAATIYDRTLKVVVNKLLTEENALENTRKLNIRPYLSDLLGRVAGTTLMGIIRWLPNVVNSASYVWNLATLSALRNDFPEHQRNNSATSRGRFSSVRSFGKGVRTVWGNPFLRKASLALSITNLAFVGINLKTVNLIADSGMPGWAAGTVLSATAVGGVVGAKLPKRLYERFSYTTLFGWGLGLWTFPVVLQALTANPFALAVSGFTIPVIGVGLNNSRALYERAVYPPEVYGRASSAMGLITGVGTAFGGLLGGVLLSTFGTVTTGWIQAAVVGTVAAASAFGGSFRWGKKVLRGLFRRGG